MGTALPRSRVAAGVRPRRHRQSPALLFIIPEQNLSQEQSIFPSAYGQPQVFCLGVLGGQLWISEKWLSQRNAVSTFICTPRKTNCDFQHGRSNNTLVTANYTAHNYIKGNGVVPGSFFLDLQGALGFHAQLCHTLIIFLPLFKGILHWV